MQHGGLIESGGQVIYHRFHPAATRQNCDREIGDMVQRISCPKSHCSSSYYKAPRGHNHLSSQSATSNYSHRSTTGPGVVIIFLLHDPILLESDIVFLGLDLSALAECILS